MKKTIQIIIGFVALGFFIVIVKNTFFTDDNKDFYDKGWEAYEKKNYPAAITFFNWVNKEKYPEITIPLGSSYMELEDYQNAIQNLQEAYEKRLGKETGDYNKVLNSLGLCYLYTGELEKSRYFLEKAKKEGNINSDRNLQILNSLEQEQRSKKSSL